MRTLNDIVWGGSIGGDDVTVTFGPGEFDILTFFVVVLVLVDRRHG